MRGILINNKIHTGDDLGLVMTEKTIGAPTPQTNYIDVPGRNGSLDLSTYLTGEVAYSNRSLRFKFVGDGSRETVLTLIDEMMLYHGHHLQITIDDYPEWYYEGRATIAYTDHGHYVEFEMSVNAQPFCYSFKPKKYELYVTESKQIAVTNVGQSIIPTITVDSDMTISSGGVSVTLSKGVYKPLPLRLPHGATIFVITGTGNIVIEFKEAVI